MASLLHENPENLNPSSRALGGHLRQHLLDRFGLLLRAGLCAPLLQPMLQINDARLQFLDAPALPVNRLEKAVECLPDVLRHAAFSPSS
jgi:Mg-chelatase subunit ChlI